MKLYFLEKKVGVKSYRIKDDTLLYITESGLFLNNNLIVKDIGNDYFTLHNGEIIYIHNGSTYITDKKIEKSILVDSLTNSTAIFSSELNLDDFTLKYELLNLNDLSLVYQFGHLPIIKTILRKNTELYLHFEGQLACFTLQNNQYKWILRQQDISILLGVYQNQLLVACSDHLLLSIDVNTGAIIREWRELPGFEAGQFYKDVLPDPSNFVLDKEAAKLIGVFDTYFFEIDLISSIISYYQLDEELAKYGINSFRPFFNNPFTTDHLFLTAHTFIDEIPGVDLSSVLALNRHTRKVDWVHIFKDTGLGTNVPQITSTHLYQLDTERNLYVFERVE